MRRRGIQLILAMAAALLLASGVAIGTSLTCKSGNSVFNPCQSLYPDQNDTITGTSSADYILGGGGDDTINASSGDDKVYGDGGNDLITGAFNNDIIYGGADDDTLYGSYNKDNITGGPGVDKVKGETEADSINADDGEVDFINCGTGTDTATANRYADDKTPMDKNSDATPLDTTTSSCETINWVRTSTPPLETTPTKPFANNCTEAHTESQVVTITKKSTTDSITLYPIISGRDKDRFSVVPTDPIYLAAGATGASATVSVTFTTPSLPPGTSDTWTGNLAFKDGPGVNNKAVAAVPLSAACVA
jgi:hypothetical protein